MKKSWKIFGALILAFGALFAGIGLSAKAANTSDAQFYGLIRITNNSTAATNVAVNFTANTSVYLAGNYFSGNFTNTAITSPAGSDVRYQPGYGGNPWIIWVPSIGANAIFNDTLYMGGSTDMQGTRRYFPASGGMAVTDNASLEPGANFTFELADTFITDGTILSKAGALLLSKSSTNVTFDVLNSSTNTTTIYPSAAGSETSISSVVGAATHWQAVSDSNDASYVTTASASYQRDLFPFGDMTANVSSVVSVEVFTRVRALNVGTIETKPSIRINGTSYDGTEVSTGLVGWTLLSQVYTTSPATGQAWTQDEINNAEFGVSMKQSGGADARVAEVYATVTYWLSNARARVTGISDSEYDLTVIADGTNIWMSVGSSVSANTSVAAVSNNASNWQWGGAGTAYLGRMRQWVGGNSRGDWQWEYGVTFADASGSGNTGTPSFRTTSTDADVLAALVQFSPVAEADAPAYTLNLSTYSWVTNNITLSAGFHSSVNASSDLIQPMKDVSQSSNTPAQLPLIIVSGVMLLAVSMGSSWIFKQEQSLSLFVQMGITLAAFSVFIAMDIIDEWVIIFYIPLALCWILASGSQMQGTGNMDQNLFGFLVSTFIGMTVINNVLKGAIISTTDLSIVNNFLAFIPWQVGVFTIPVPNIAFLTNAIPALLNWDEYGMFLGNTQFLTYLMYSFTAVVTYILFGLSIGTVSRLFSR